MKTFDNYLLPKDTSVRRRIEIDNTLYNKLSELTEIYDASINKMVNIAILELIKTENIKIYKRPDNEITNGHNFLIRESSYKKLEELRDKYGLSIYKLINIAIFNALHD